MGFYPNLQNMDLGSALVTGWQMAEAKREREASKATLARELAKDRDERVETALTKWRSLAPMVDKDEWERYRSYGENLDPQLASLLPSDVSDMPEPRFHLLREQIAKGKDFSFDDEKASYDQQTIYGPGGKTQRVSIKKGETYTPPGGWSLEKPGEVDYETVTLHGPKEQTRLVSVPEGEDFTPPEGWSLAKREKESVSKDAATLRKEFTRGAKTFVDVRDAYSRIQASAEEPSAAGDLAMIFNYMKMLDPESVVREGEFATAANAGGVPDQVKASYNKILSGKRLSERQRADFTNRADKLYERQLQAHDKLVHEYSRLADAYGIEPANVIVDYVLQQAGGLPEEIASQIPEGEAVTLSNGQKWGRINGELRRLQ